MSQYTYDLKNEFRVFGIKTSKTEIKDIAIAWVVLSVAFYLMVMGFSIDDPAESILFALFSLVAIGLGFIVHELAHKLVANHFGYPAEFRKDMNMLILTLIISIFGLLFAAPGGVYILGNVTEKKNGIISFAGPFSNFMVALLLLPFFLIAEYAFIGLLMKINLFLALFNLIPILNFDGAKIFRWNKTAYFTLMIFAGALLVYVWFKPV